MKTTINTNTLCGVNDSDVVRRAFERAHAASTHTWMNLNGRWQVAIIEMVDEEDDSEFMIGVYEIDADNPNIGYQYFDRHASSEIERKVIGEWLYPTRNAMIDDFGRFIDANVHSS